MTSWDLSTLVGARVVFSATDAEGNAHEARGTIIGVLKAGSGEKEADATNSSQFSVKTDAGEAMTVDGAALSRVDTGTLAAEAASSS